MMTDPIADMLTRIRNAVRVERPLVELPLSKVKRGVAEVLKREGYIWDWEEVPGEPTQQIRIHLKYGPNGERVIRHVRRISTPGLRRYVGATEIPRVRGGLGVAVTKSTGGALRDSAVAQTGACGAIKILKIENKGRHNRRVRIGMA